MGNDFFPKTNSQSTSFNSVMKTAKNFYSSSSFVNNFYISVFGILKSSSLRLLIKQNVKIFVSKINLRRKLSANIIIPDIYIFAQTRLRNMFRANIRYSSPIFYFFEYHVTKKVPNVFVNFNFNIKIKAISQILSGGIIRIRNPKVNIDAVNFVKRYNFLDDFDTFYLSDIDNLYLTELDYTIL